MNHHNSKLHLKKNPKKQQANNGLFMMMHCSDFAFSSVMITQTITAHTVDEEYKLYLQ